MQKRNAILLVSALCLVAAAFFALKFRSHFRHSHGNDSGPAKAFYFWKTRWAPTASELTTLTDLGVNRLYLRFFDVSWDPQKSYPIPVAPLEFKAKIPTGTEVIPVVYIRNNVFQKISNQNLNKFADQVWEKVGDMARGNQISFKQLQIDCDWTDKTRAPYFHFLEVLKQKNNKIALSATIRLHQVKYASRTGIPPVDRGMLMFYNMGRLEISSDRLSIYNSHDASAYVGSIENYKLKLDIVLPIFSWVVHSRYGRIQGLIEKTTAAEIEQSTGFEKKSEREYFATQSFFLHGVYFKKGDRLSIEEITPALTAEAANLLARNWGSRSRPNSIALFDFDERNIKKYETDDFTRAFRIFN